MLVFLLSLVAVAGVWVVRRWSDRASGADGAGEAARRAAAARIVPESVRVQVEVFNATDTRGLARTAAAVLRDAGFDVVYFGNTSLRLDSSFVRDRSGHADWAAWASRVVAPARSDAIADSGRFVDLTIYVGRSWRPPREPFRP